MKYIVIDNGVFFFRSIFSWRNNRNLPIIWLWLRSIIACLKRIQIDPEDKIILAIDSSKGSWRKQVYKEYKAQRKEQREKYLDVDWQSVFDEFNYNLEQYNHILDWHFIMVDFAEADDIGAVVSKYFKDNEVILVSSDCDWEQLAVRENVRIFSNISKKFKTVKNPYKVLQQKIMKGDIADNIKGVKEEGNFEEKVKIISLLNLPEDIETKIIEKIKDLPKKELRIEDIPFESVRKQYYKIYEREVE